MEFLGGGCSGNFFSKLSVEIKGIVVIPGGDGRMGCIILL